MPESISSTANAAATTATASTQGALGQLDSNAFLKLLTAQLRYQNPFSPSDPSAMLGQVATYAQVEALQKIQAAQASTTALEQARMAGEMMGKRVTGTDANGTALSGIVASARFTASGPMLVLDSGKEMALARVEVIAPGSASAPAPAPAATTPSSTTGSSGSGTGTGTASSGASGPSGTSGSGTSGSSPSPGSGSTPATNPAATNPAATTPAATNPAATNPAANPTAGAAAATAPTGTTRRVVADVTAYGTGVAARPATALAAA